MMILQAVSGYSLGLNDLFTLLGGAAIVGGLIKQSKYHDKRQDSLDKHWEEQRKEDRAAWEEQRKEDKRAVDLALAQIEARAAERTAALETRHNTLEERFLGAIERLGDSMARLTTRLETVVGVHENRLVRLEEESR